MNLTFPLVDPRAYQLPFYKAMDNGCNRAVKSWPRRAGKDISDFQFLIREALKRVGTYYYYFPTLELAKKALWDNIVEFYYLGNVTASGNMIDILCPEAIRETKNNSDHFIRLINGSIIKIGGTDKLDVVGMNGYGYVFSEWQSQKKEAFGYISPILQENGGWALFNGTMRGKRNHLYQDIHKTASIDSWFSQWLSPEDTLEYYWINEEEGIDVNRQLCGAIHPHTLRPFKNIQDIVDAGEISFSLAKQEYLNRADNEVDGGYYGYEITALRKRGGIKSIDPYREPVYTFWDLGGSKEENDATAITFAQCDTMGRVTKIVDYYKNRGHLRGHYWDHIKSKGYNYGGHYFPHDGKRTNPDTGESSGETASNVHGMEVRLVPKSQKTSNDIEICRRRFVGLEFNDTPECMELFDDLSCYHENEATQMPCHKNNCKECNGASHAADSFRTMQMALHHNLVTPYLQGSFFEEEYEEPEEDWLVV